MGQRLGGACGTGGKTAHLKQNKGDRSLLNKPQGSRGQDKRKRLFTRRQWVGTVFKEGR